MNARTVIVCFLLIVFLAISLSTFRSKAAQAPTGLLAQDAEGANPRLLTDAERNSLADPLFLLVLKDHSDANSLDAVEQLLQPNPANRRVFVVDENVADPRRPQSRRAVLTYDGVNPNLPGVQLTSNVMLSIFFSDTEFSNSATEIEAWGWDAGGGRYNFYKLNSRNAEPMQWKFRGSSDGADTLSLSVPTDCAGKCVRCHINGGPIMKELLFPWNNWHSFQSQINYLMATQPAAWPVAQSSHLARAAGQSGGLTQAEQLETLILAPIRRFNALRIRKRFVLGFDGDTPRVDANGFAQIDQPQNLLRPLFVTTEFNLISSGVKSGLHPIPQLNNQGPSQPIPIPSSLFLNANLLHGGGFTGYQSFNITSADFADLPPITPTEYKTLIQETGVKIGGKPGDADFAWFVPEPSHIDNDKIDQLIRLGVITREFAAAVLAVDLENPMFSKDRERLLSFIPNQFRFKPGLGGNRHPDELTSQVIAALENAAPANGTPEMTLLQLLKDPNPVAKLQEQVDAYHTREKNQLLNQQTRVDELRRLYRKALDIRRAVRDHPVLRNLDETDNPGRLLPLP